MSIAQQPRVYNVKDWYSMWLDSILIKETEERASES